jgi:hypothetical protein
VVNDT